MLTIRRQNYSTEELMLQCELLDKTGEYEVSSSHVNTLLCCTFQGMLNCAICRVKKKEPMSLEDEVAQRDM